MKAVKIVITAMIIASLPAESLFAEYVFLKDGNIIQGQIIAENSTDIVILKSDKKRETIKRSNTMRVLYTELYLGKIFIQLTNGQNIACYMVDEDRESYTFRMELYSPEEFKYKRDQVLFIARGNPTGLEGEADTTSVKLKWFPPYQPPKKYRVYIRSQAEKDFRIADETSASSIKIKELKSNTKYTAYVTAIDRTGDESLPSNEFVFTTKNIPPDEPEITGVDKLSDGTIKITWKEPADPDGKVTGYRVYKKLDGALKQIAELKKTEYILSKSEEYDNLYVTAFDDLKSESDFSRIYTGRRPQPAADVSLSVLIPADKLGKIAVTGYGITSGFIYQNLFIEGFEPGAVVSFYYLPGKSGFIENESKAEGIIIMPVMLMAGYSFYPLENLSFTPRAGAGGFCVFYNYSYYDIPSSSRKTVSDWEIVPGFSAGLASRYDYSETVYFSVAADYNMFFEDSGNFSYIAVSAGAGLRF